MSLFIRGTGGLISNTFKTSNLAFGRTRNFSRMTSDFSLMKMDPEVHNLITQETSRQKFGLELIKLI